MEILWEFINTKKVEDLIIKKNETTTCKYNQYYKIVTSLLKFDW